MEEADRNPSKEYKLYKIFKKAIESEQVAQHMYQEALSCCDDANMEQILQALHDDEVRHEEELRQFYFNLRQKYEPDGTEKDDVQ